MALLITGVAGFIGCNLARSYIDQGHTVFGIDNLSRGSLDNLLAIKPNPRFTFRQVDMAQLADLRSVVIELHQLEAITEVWHLAANSDIPAGANNAQVDLRDTFMTSFNTLVVMKELNIKVMAFASSSAIYGDLGDQPLVEDIGPLLPISNYGAMKLASEAAISAATENYLERAFIFRFPNVIGTPATHGVILDFIRKLKISPHRLTVLGNGNQQKGYLHVDELISAMMHIRRHAKDKVSVLNIGSDDEGASVRYIAEQTVAIVAPHACIAYGNADRGWVGDVPRFTYSIKRLRLLGWTPQLKSCDAVTQAIHEIAEQESAK